MSTRATAAALVQDRALWLAERAIMVPDHHMTAYRDAWAEAVGLYEDSTDGDEDLIGCMLLHRPPAPRTGDTAQRRVLRISRVYTAPGRNDMVGRLLTLWAADFAARVGVAEVECEVPARHAGGDSTLGRLLDHLRSLGWLVTGTGHSRDGERVVRLQLAAQGRGDGLAAMVACTISLDSTDPTADGSLR
ncbi:hypothetical protein ABT246_25650 [Streptomyces sp. NPDC001553]|uniref:hypothetical protein n=1 Tax=Streptomyces sp. NPDC001553 TaxID=3154385 RepID=UPI00332148EE